MSAKSWRAVHPSDRQGDPPVTEGSVVPGPQKLWCWGMPSEGPTPRWALPAPHTGHGVCRAPHQALAVIKWCELHRAAGMTSVFPGPQRLGESYIPWRTLLQGAGEPQLIAGKNNSCLHPADSRASPLATEQPSPGDV